MADFPSFRIGSQALPEPLVKTDQIRTHLSLLGAFLKLRKKLEELSGDQVPEHATNLKGAQRWAWFVALAVERFQRWIETVPFDIQPTSEHAIVPLDVLMVWHTYLLNPGWYFEDFARLKILRKMRRLRDAFPDVVFRMGNALSFSPTNERATSWETLTRTPFDPFASINIPLLRTVRCPKCTKTFESPFLTMKGTGYAQKNFIIICEGCNHSITHETLGLAKVARPLAIDYGGDRTGDFEPLPAGSIYTPQHRLDLDGARETKALLMRQVSIKGLDTQTRVISIAEGGCQWELENYRALVKKALRDRPTLRLLVPCSTDRPFSVNLVDAVLRQGTFIDKMRALGWISDSKAMVLARDGVLQVVLARYHAWLDLIAAGTRKTFWVPTLDIDLAWHTHQLLGDRYHQDCRKYIQLYIDHDDQVEEGRLSDAFAATERAWNSRYGVPYTNCGCPQPKSSLGDRMSSLRNRISGNNSGAHQNLASQEKDSRAGSHPSDHNAVTVKSADEQFARQPTMRPNTDPSHVQKERAFLVPPSLVFPSAPCIASPVVMTGGVIDSPHVAGGALCAAGGCGTYHV